MSRQGSDGKSRANASRLHELVLADGRNAVEVATSHISLQAFRYRLKKGQPLERAATAPAKPGRFSSVRTR